MIHSHRRVARLVLALCVLGTCAALVHPAARATAPQAPLAEEPGTPVAIAPSTLPAPPAVVLKPFSARYKVEAFGFTAGTADIVLEGGADGRYQYRTALHPHGLFHLMVSNGAALTSWVEVNGANVRPLRYSEEDGTTSTDEDVALEFDWNHGVVAGTAHRKAVRIDLPARTQDPLSLQVAVLLDFASGRVPQHYAMVDKTKIKQYDYKPEGQARIATALGMLDTVIYSSTRLGSSKITRVWYAPSLGFAPVRSDDIDDGSLRVHMTIMSLKR